MLGIRVDEDDQEILITLEGCVGGMDVSHLIHAWADVAPRRGDRMVSIDLREVTDSDKGGVRALGEIYTRTNARLLAGKGSAEAEVLALEVLYGQEDGVLVDEREWLAMES